MSKRNRRSTRRRKKGLPPGTLIYTGTRPRVEGASVLSVRCSPQAYEEDAAYRPDWARTNGGYLWVDVRGLSDEAFIKRVGDDFKIHYLALEDVLDTQQRAKLEEYEDGLFFILPNLRLLPETLGLEHEQIALFVTAHYLVSFQEDPDDTFQAVRNRAREGMGRLRKKGTDYLTYALMDTVVDNYYTLLDEFEHELLEVEAEVHRQGVDSVSKDRVFELKRVINQFRHRILPLREAVTRFYRSDHPLIDDSNRLYLRDVVDHMAQILDSTDNYRDMVANVEALLLAETSNRLNNVMRLLTVISTIFIPLSFIASVYGMNFDNMPELHSRYGYYIVLGIMFTAMVGMLVYFRRKRWI
jgi:magnesium transporter